MKRILAGPHAVTEALRLSAGGVEAVLIAESTLSDQTRRIEKTAHHLNITVEMVSTSALNTIAGDVRHQGVLAIAGTYPYLDFTGLIRHAEKQAHPLIAVLDQIQDPRNLGAVMRSAHAFGATGLIIPKDRAARVTAVTVRASAGASELVKTALVTNLARALTILRSEGYRILGAALGSTARVHDLDWRGPTALVLGNEAKGLRRLTATCCDLLFTIPMVNDFDSLNISAAAAIALFEASKQRFASIDAVDG